MADKLTFHAFSQLPSPDLLVVTGACRSGKTTLAKLLASHRDVEFQEEPWLGMMLPVLCHLGEIERAPAETLFQAYFEELCNDLVLLRGANFRPVDQSFVYEFKTRSAIRRRLVDLRSRADVVRYVAARRPLIVITLTETAPALSWLARALPRARFLHVVRNGLAVAAELAAREEFVDERLRLALNNIPYRRLDGLFLPWWVPPREQRIFLSLSGRGRAAYYWQRMVALGHQEIVRLSRKRRTLALEVRFEDLVEDPRRLLERIHAWLRRRSPATRLTRSQLARFRRPAHLPDRKGVDLPGPLQRRFWSTMQRMGYRADSREGR